MSKQGRVEMESIRGQSEVIGTVLLFGLVIAGTGMIVFLGSPILENTTQAVQTQQAEHSMAQFDSQVAQVALGGSPAKQIEIVPQQGEGTVEATSDGWMRIQEINYTTGTVESTYANQTIGTFVYTNGGEEVAYQGGGIWRKTDTGSQMISPPEFHYRSGTLTLPLITVNGTSHSLKGPVMITQTEDTQRVYPNPSKSWANPVTSGKVLITVKSDYYQAWGEHFETRTDSKVTYNHNRDLVTVELVSEVKETTVTGAIVSGAAGSTLTINNNAEVDSYNSSQGNYSVTEEKNTSIFTAGDVVVQNHGTVQGDLASGEDVTMNNHATITGNLSYTGTLDKHKQATVNGWTSRNASLPELQSVNGLINQQRDMLRNESVNDNLAEEDINDAIDRLKQGQSTWELESGQYYLSRVQLQNSDKLVLDTSDGNIDIVVDGQMQIQKSDVTVKGDGRVNFYLTEQFTLGDSSMSAPGDDATQLWVFMKSDESMTFQNHAEFVGVIFGPGSNDQSGVTIQLQNHAQIYGGLVGYVEQVQNHAEIHFDEELMNTKAIEGEHIATINYLYITNQTVSISS